MQILKKYSNLLLVSASCLALSSCLPEDESVLSERQLRNVESQIQIYARSFQQYQSRSLNEFVNSATWRAQVASQGLLPDDGMGNASTFLSNAYCEASSGDVAYHLTWFNRADSDNHVSLKGIGTDLIGQTNQKIKSLIPDAQFAIYDGSNIVMGDNSVLSLSPGCSLDIPTNSAVAAVSLPAPDNLLALDTKTLLRTRACDMPNTQGSITESTEISFTATGDSITYFYNGSEFSSEDAVTGAVSSADWAVMSNECVVRMPRMILAESGNTANMINTNALAGISGDVSAALSNQLSDIDCVHVGEGEKDVNDLDGDGDTEEFIFNNLDEEFYQTCITESDLDLKDEGDIRELESFETVLMDELTCPIETENYAGDGRIIMDSSEFFSGISPSLVGVAGQIETDSVSGNLDIDKTVKTFISLVDLGAGLPVIDAASARIAVSDEYGHNEMPNHSRLQSEICQGQDGCSVHNNVRIEGTGGQCMARQTITFSCRNMYPGLTPIAGGGGGSVAETRNVLDNLISSIKRNTGSSGSGGGNRDGDSSDNGGGEHSYAGSGGRTWESREAAMRDGGTGSRRSGSATNNSGHHRSQGGQSGGGGGGGSSGGGGRVLCTYFTVERGWLPKKAYIGNLKYGQENFSEVSLNGYHYWAVPLVKYLRKHKGSLRERLVFKMLVEGWVYETAHRQGYHDKGDWRGKLVLATIKPLCTIIGKCVRRSDYKSLWTGMNIPTA